MFAIPSRSRPASALQSILARNGIIVPLNIAQAAVDSVLTCDGTLAAPSSIAPEAASCACRHCELPLVGQYCSDAGCPYYEWPQAVPFGRLRLQSTAELEKRYGPKRFPEIPAGSLQFGERIWEICNMMDERELSNEFTQNPDVEKAVVALAMAARIHPGDVWREVWEAGPAVVELNHADAELMPSGDLPD